MKLCVLESFALYGNEISYQYNTKLVIKNNIQLEHMAKDQSLVKQITPHLTGSYTLMHVCNEHLCSYVRACMYVFT